MSDCNFLLPFEVGFIIDRLSEQGYRADVVGGPVRDMLRGVSPSDFDITTSAKPDEVKSCFPDLKIVDTGIKHGTVTLFIDGVGYEITTYRIDGEYLDSRHPESVSFTTELSLDLSRRDFTMNAIAYSERYGITDLHRGREDIEAKIIRAVGDPDTRFKEDALRILRAVRFASTLGFTLDEGTDAAVRRCAPLLANVSVERIYTEWYKLLSGVDRYRILSDYPEVISVFLPELFENGNNLRLPELFENKNDLSRPELFGEEGSAKESPVSLMLALFWLNAVDQIPETYRKAMIRLHTDGYTRNAGALALSAIGEYDTDTQAGIGKLMMDFGKEVARLTVETEILLGMTPKSSQKTLDNFINDRCPYRPQDLDVSGADLMYVGYKGAKVGEIMRKLLLEVIEGRLQNNRSALLARLDEMRDNG